MLQLLSRKGKECFSENYASLLHVILFTPSGYFTMKRNQAARHMWSLQ